VTIGMFMKLPASVAKNRIMTSLDEKPILLNAVPTSPTNTRMNTIIKMKTINVVIKFEKGLYMSLL